MTVWPLDSFCDMCDALLTEPETHAGKRYEHDLCDFCAAEMAVANPTDEDETP